MSDFNRNHHAFTRWFAEGVLSTLPEHLQEPAKGLDELYTFTAGRTVVPWAEPTGTSRTAEKILESIASALHEYAASTQRAVDEFASTLATEYRRFPSYRETDYRRALDTITAATETLEFKIDSAAEDAAMELDCVWGDPDSFGDFGQGAALQAIAAASVVHLNEVAGHCSENPRDEALAEVIWQEEQDENVNRITCLFPDGLRAFASGLEDFLRNITEPAHLRAIEASVRSFVHLVEREQNVLLDALLGQESDIDGARRQAIARVDKAAEHLLDTLVDVAIAIGYGRSRLSEPVAEIREAAVERLNKIVGYTEPSIPNADTAPLPPPFQNEDSALASYRSNWVVYDVKDFDRVARSHPEPFRAAHVRRRKQLLDIGRKLGYEKHLDPFLLRTLMFETVSTRIAADADADHRQSEDAQRLIDRISDLLFAWGCPIGFDVVEDAGARAGQGLAA